MIMFSLFKVRQTAEAGGEKSRTQQKFDNKQTNKANFFLSLSLRQKSFRQIETLYHDFRRKTKKSISSNIDRAKSSSSE